MHPATCPGYQGATLLDILESVDVSTTITEQPFRFPVQLISRPQHAESAELHDFRGYQGRIESGRVRVGDTVAIAPHGRSSHVKDIVVFELGRLRSRSEAQAPQSVTLLLEDNIDISRGDLIAGIAAAPLAAKEFSAVVCWMDGEPLDLSRKYLLKLGAKTVTAKFAGLDARLDVHSGLRLDADTLGLNDIGIARIKTQQAVAFDAYRDNRATGGFIVIDEVTNHTVAAGMISG